MKTNRHIILLIMMLWGLTSKEQEAFTLKTTSTNNVVNNEGVSTIKATYKIDFGPDRDICDGETILLNAYLPGATYTWQNGSTASSYTVHSPGTYWVQAYIADSNITVGDTIVIDPCISIFVPNCFMPNSFVEACNTFKIITMGEFSEFKLYIYNRRALLLFESSDKYKGWDGTYRGQLMPEDAYPYVVTGTIKGSNKKIEKYGTVILLK